MIANIMALFSWVCYLKKWARHAFWTSQNCDNHVRSFDALETFTIDQSVVGSLYFGNENKSFNSLVSITGIDSFVTGFVVSGTKDLANVPATLTLDEGDYGYLLVNDNAIGVFDFGAISLSGITLDGTGTHPIRLAHLDLANIAFDEGNGDRRIRLQGDFPYLETISLSNMGVGELYIGNPLSEFDVLTSITFDSFNASSIRIGERDVSFDVLASITFNDVVVANTISIGYENSSYPLLETISVSETTTNVFALGRMNDSFDALKIFSFEDVTIVTELMVQGAIAPVLEVMLLHRVTLPVMNIMFASADYDMYVDTLTISNDFYISDTCATIYVTNDPASSWAYYARATELGIPVVTGTYSPA